MFWVYVIANPAGAIYIGQSADLQARLAQHNDPAYRLTLHTKRIPGPWRLIYAEALPERHAAIRRERQLKSSRGRAWIRDLLAIAPASQENPCTPPSHD